MSGRHEQITALLRHMPNRRDIAHAFLLKEEELEKAEARLGRAARAWTNVDSQFTLCRYTGELSKQRDTNVRGQGGECPVHGGDACLSQYVQASALERAVLVEQEKEQP